jgi:hypothetical protein
MPGLIQFTAAGSPRELSRAIEDFATGQGSLTAIVVPWESTAGNFSMAVTSTKGEGWALEHTNLGTIKLIDLSDGSTRVEVLAQQSGSEDTAKLAALFDRFSIQLETKFRVRA